MLKYVKKLLTFGESFVVLLPDTDLDGALIVANDIRMQIENASIEHSTSTVSRYVTVSVGVATLIPKEGITSNFLLNEADEALYKAKDIGRNRVCTMSND